MKKLTLLLLGLFIYAGTAQAQAIDDRAVIPVAVTLNTILRLNVTSGGNIEFNFNTLADYNSGINNSDRYNTEITIASSTDWNLAIYAEDAALVGTDDQTGASIMDLDNIGYDIAFAGTDAGHEDNIAGLDEINALSSTVASILTPSAEAGATGNAGGIAQNAFTIQWRCGTSEGGGMNAASILDQSIPAGRFATNVFLVLEPVTD